jgi:hypothetical protein
MEWHKNIEIWGRRNSRKIFWGGEEIKMGIELIKTIDETMKKWWNRGTREMEGSRILILVFS